MDITQLDYFLKICDHGSFTQAARSCYISPQGINSAILRLEKELQTELFVRSNTGVRPTAEGEYLYRMASQIVPLFRECEAHFKDESEVQAPMVISLATDVLSALPQTASNLIVNRYGMVIQSGGGYQCESNLLNFKSSFALVDGPPFSPKLTYQHCFKRDYLFVANKLHKMANRRNLRFRDLEDCKFVTPNATHKIYGNFVDLCMENQFSPNIDMFANSLTETYSILHHHADLIGISCDTYMQSNTDPNIVVLPVTDLAWSYDIYLSYRKKTNLDSRESSFLSDFLSSFSGGAIL